MIVGAGHDPPAPNSVLVLTGREAFTPRHNHPNILIELGGHSSAPDMPPFGQFSAGLDVNWHIDDLWGTRDEQATAGLSFSGRYEGTMTYPRDAEDAVTLFPRGLGASGEESREVLADLVRVSPDYLAERAHQASHGRTSLPRSGKPWWTRSSTAIGPRAGAEEECGWPSADRRGRRPSAGLRQKSPQYQAGIGDAVKEDSVTRRADLDRLEAQRLEDVRSRVREALLVACVRSTPRTRRAPAATRWPRVSMPGRPRS